MDDELHKRLTLLNQYTILAHVDPDNADYWLHAAGAVRDNWPIDDLPDVDRLKESARDPLTAEHRTFILDIFDVYDRLQVAEDNGHQPKDGRKADFPGFDGNNETKLMSYARDMRQRRRLFESVRLANADLNSHHPTLAMYGRMIAEWKRRGQPAPFSGEDYEAIMEAQKHPG